MTRETTQIKMIMKKISLCWSKSKRHNIFPKKSKEGNPLPPVEVEEDIIGKPASIAYHDCLRQLCEFVALPIDSCKGKDPITQKQCQAKGPFEINIKSRVTAAVIEWVSHVLVAHVI